jgi:pimeloyl-ACP methyl ester carboxylesterase
MPKPFTIAVPDERLASIRAKVAAFDWGAVPDAGGWESGVGLADLKRLVDYWQTRYDWRAQERRMNAFPQFTADVRGQRLHFVHVRGDGSRLPLLLLHGWPGSFLEFETLIAPLVADGHDVVVPSLPGYAFSGKPASPIGPRQTAELMHDLMVELFGGGRYLIQGGDWGAAIGAWMAYGHPRAVAALHLNMLLIQAEDAIPKAPAELAWAARRAELAKEETGYSQEQGTRPQTLGIAMSDSPVGCGMDPREVRRVGRRASGRTRQARSLAGVRRRCAPEHHHALSGRGIVRDVDVDVSRSCARGVGQVPQGHADQGPDCRRGVPRSGVPAPATIASAQDLRHRPMDRDGGWRPFCGTGTTGVTACRHAKVLWPQAGDDEDFTPVHRVPGDGDHRRNTGSCGTVYPPRCETRRLGMKRVRVIAAA